MTQLQDALNLYVMDQENPELNWKLAECYWEICQTASALSFYLRAAEQTDDYDMAYVCLCKVAICLELAGNRNNSVRRMAQQAIHLLPKRPEAYFIVSRSYEMAGEYVDSYMYADLALSHCDFDLPPLRAYVEYPGKYGLVFEKAVCGWYWGREDESRKLFIDMVPMCDKMEERHRKAIQRNIMFLGHGPKDRNIRPYDKSKKAELRVKFPGYEDIDNNFSAVYQDMFVLSMLNGKKNGFYLEIGGGRPFFGNNTALLEKLGWKGVSVELVKEFCDEFARDRKNPAVCENALEIDYKKLLRSHTDKNVVDYLQLDIEPPENTFKALCRLPFEEYKFAVITYEHDHYADIDQCYRERSRRYLSAMGYHMIVNDISVDGVHSFEDWWYHPDLIDVEAVDAMMCVNDSVKEAEAYMLGKI